MGQCANPVSHLARAAYLLTTLAFLLLSRVSSVCVVELLPVGGAVCIALLRSAGCLFVLVVVSLAVRSCSFSLLSHLPLGSGSQKSSQTTAHTFSVCVLFVFYCFKPYSQVLVHFEVIFVWGVRWRCAFTLLHVAFRFSHSICA